ncbi:MAG: hypothetical protein K6L81_07405 [Agarilytica sp.]
MSDDEQLIDSSVKNPTESQNTDPDEGVVDIMDSVSAVSAKEAERERIQAEVAAFLNSGGRITCVDTEAMSDPPKAPASNYGGQPI